MKSRGDLCPLVLPPASIDLPRIHFNTKRHQEALSSMETTLTRSRGQKSIGHELDQTRVAAWIGDADAGSSMPFLYLTCPAFWSSQPRHEMFALAVTRYLKNPIPLRLTGDLELSLGSTRSAREHGHCPVTPCLQQACIMPTWDIFFEACLVNSLIRQPSSRTPQRFVCALRRDG